MVGINDYKYDGEIQDLRGTANDVEAMRDLLTRRFDFAPAQIVTLRDQQATKANILSEFRRQLIEPATPDAVVIFYFSGHGSQMWDTSGDEADSYDETLVAQDSGRSGEHENRDISDDELNALLKELGAKTSHVTIILDSCHSGTAVRAAGTPKAAPRDDRGRPEHPAARGAGAAPADGLSGFRSADMSYVLISGAASTEYSYEYVIDGHPTGALTWFLTRALWESAPRATYRDVFERVATDVSVSFPAQHPQIEGLEKDTQVFGTIRYAPQPYFEVSSSQARIELQAGAVHGVTPHSRFAVYPPGTQQFTGVAPLAQLEVTKVGGTTSEVTSSIPGQLPRDARAVEIEHQFDQVALRVSFPEPEGLNAASAKNRLAELARGLHDYAQIQVVAAGDTYDMAVLVDGASGRFSFEGGTDGVSLGAAADPSKAVRQLVAWAKWYALWRLGNEQSSPLAVSLELPEGTDARAGSALPIVVHNDSATRLYFSLLDLSSDGSVVLAYPPAGAQEFIEPAAVWRYSLTPCVPSQRSEVRDVLKVVLTQQPHNLALLEQDPIAGMRSARENQRHVEDLFGGVAMGQGARGVLPPTLMPVDGWVTRQVGIHVQATPGAQPCDAPASPRAAQPRKASPR